MVVLGAGGLARQIRDVLHQLKLVDESVLFDNVTTPPVDTRFGMKVLTTKEDLVAWFKKDGFFIPGIASPADKKKLIAFAEECGGTLSNLISPAAHISDLDVQTGTAVILTSAIIENGVSLGKGVLINIGAFVTHETQVGDYTEIAPGARLLGKCRVGSMCSIGTGAIILPKVTIGDNVIVAAGAVVTTNIPSNVMVAGVPAVVKKKL
jgi:sugar O-acyltransferase (sialic acid O-acetyltransferase NeuD family)